MVKIKQKTTTHTMSTGAPVLLRVFLLLTLLASTAVQAANITVTTSRNPVALDDSFHLIYEADNNVDDDPDFTPVYKHFDVLSSSQSTNMRSINGNWSLKKKWDLAVIAKNTGKFTIPPINFGKDISPAIRITVKSSSSPNTAKPKGQGTIPAKIFLESSVDKKSGWIQSQFIYTIRLLRTVNIIGASITEPQLSDADAIIQQINEDKYQTTRNGIRYEVFERRYAIFPQKSGTLKIKPVMFEGRVTTNQPRTIFDQFRMSGQIKRLRSKAINITVKAAPASVNLQDWLPASELQLSEEWSADIKNLTAGEPVTRTITIAAEGLTGVQLPELVFDNIKGLKQYPDKHVIENKQDSTGIIGFKQIKVALIPAEAGRYTLPEIKLQWWNTKTNKQQTSTLPPTTLAVTGSVNIDNTAAPVAQPENTALDEPLPADKKTPAAETGSVMAESYWKNLSLFLAFAWLVTLVLLFKKPKTEKPAEDKNRKLSVKQATASVEKYAAKNNALLTKNALIDWAKLFYAEPAISNLSLVADRCSIPLAEEINKLNQSLYNPEKPDWNNKQLLSAFKNEQSLKHAQKDHQNPVLKPLYNR